MGIALILIAAAACYISGGTYQEKKWRMFILTIAVSTFINMAMAFQFHIAFSYTMVLQLLYVLIDLLFGKSGRVSKRAASSFILFILSIGLGLLYWQ